ncbi:hypothetical protein O3M35_000106 [Rhynocoris fuscipes]|uniref:SCP domain-containing protein n=1 Tax=Rhynocoris fuscipes TaxID=488301 RepID=A0AAW1DMC4_9HEMI
MFEIILLSYLIMVLLSWMVSGVNVYRCECGPLKSLYILAYIIIIISHGIEDKSVTASTEFYKLSQEQKDKIVKIHNLYRNLVASGLERRGGNGTGQPPAQNMREMVWDNYLAYKAKELTQMCFNLEYPHRYPDNLTMMGQNRGTVDIPSCDIAQHYDSTIEFIFKEWYEEVEDYNLDTSPPLKTTKHYAQIIWAKSYKVGCSVGTCVRSDCMLFITCDYYMKGNVERRVAVPGLKFEMVYPKAYAAGELDCKGFKLYPPETYSHLCIAPETRSGTLMSGYPTVCLITVCMLMLLTGNHLPYCLEGYML